MILIKKVCPRTSATSLESTPIALRRYFPYSQRIHNERAKMTKLYNREQETHSNPAAITIKMRFKYKHSTWKPLITTVRPCAIPDIEKELEVCSLSMSYWVYKQDDLVMGRSIISCRILRVCLPCSVSAQLRICVSCKLADTMLKENAASAPTLSHKAKQRRDVIENNWLKPRIDRRKARKQNWTIDGRREVIVTKTVTMLI